MLQQVSESKYHLIRWIVTSGWLLLIFSLFYDPLSPWLTDVENKFSPLRVNPDVCIKVQDICLPETPYPVGATIFWTAIVPSAIIILLVFGHEVWRRICPLSFLSQIARNLSLQRKDKYVNPKTGKVTHRLAKVEPDSWLGRNYLYLQFTLFYLGVCSRILFVNSNRIALGLFILVTIFAAIFVGYWYGGKSWCNYFCPMSPVQRIYSEPRGLLTSAAHTVEKPTFTQSMCRRVDPSGKEESACVGCNAPCFDIDAENCYWQNINRPEYKLLYYGYFGLIVGYFLYYYLYAGNWNYYFSAAWSHEENQFATLFAPGFYLFNHPMDIPKIVAVPLTLLSFTFLGYILGIIIEILYKKVDKSLAQEKIQHRIYTIFTFFSFNFFFIFAARNWINQLPIVGQIIYQLILMTLSIFWLYRTWERDPELYSQEKQAKKFKKKLKLYDISSHYIL